MSIANGAGMSAEPTHGPGVNFPPPFLFVIGIAAGWGLNTVRPMPVSAVLAPPWREACGWSAVIVGAALLVVALLTFAVARTAIFPNRPARAIVARGLYRCSRNPMYVALAVGTAGVGMLVDSAWILILLPGVLAALYRLVIRREEAYLASAFGDDYAEYRARVRRWL